MSTQRTKVADIFTRGHRFFSLECHFFWMHLDVLKLPCDALFHSLHHKSVIVFGNNFPVFAQPKINVDQFYLRHSAPASNQPIADGQKNNRARRGSQGSRESQDGVRQKLGTPRRPISPKAFLLPRRLPSEEYPDGTGSDGGVAFSRLLPSCRYRAEGRRRIQLHQQTDHFPYRLSFSRETRQLCFEFHHEKRTNQ